MLWSAFVPAKKTQERLSMKMSDLVEHVSKQPLPPHTRNLLVEVMVNDENDEDVEVSATLGLIGVDYWLLTTRFPTVSFTFR